MIPPDFPIPLPWRVGDVIQFDVSLDCAPTLYAELSGRQARILDYGESSVDRILDQMHAIAVDLYGDDQSFSLESRRSTCQRRPWKVWIVEMMDNGVKHWVGPGDFRCLPWTKVT